MTQKTTSEAVFEQFCTAKRIRWERIPTEDTTGFRTPDYFIFPAGVKIAAEVKEVSANTLELKQERRLQETGWSTFGCTVGDRARNLINTGAKQLRTKAKGSCAAIVVIHNPNWLLRHHTEPHSIKAAMYGFDTIVLGLSPDMTQKPSLIERKSGAGRMMTDHHNTTVSAVAVIDDAGLTLYHNVFAAIPLNPETFKEVAVRQFKLANKSLGKFAQWEELVLELQTPDSGT